MKLLREILIEAPVDAEIQRIKAEIARLIKERDKYPAVGFGGEVDPRRTRINAALKAKREELNILRGREPERAELEAGRREMATAPPPRERPKRKPTTLKGPDLEAAIRMAVEDMAQNERGELIPGSVSGEDIHDWIRKNLGEEVARTTIDRHLSNNPNLKDLEKYRKVGRSAGMTDIEREQRYLKQRYRR